MNTQQMVTLNKSHLTLDTLKKLGTKEGRMSIPCVDVYPKGGFGYFIYIREAYKDGYFNNPTYHNACPADLRVLLAYAVENGYDVVCLDEETAPVIFLPQYHYDFNITITKGINAGEKCTIETIWYGGEPVSEKTFML